MTERMEEIKARWAAVPAGPWGWFGSPYSGFYLATNHSGREYVMGFARLGMNDAQPLFRRGNVMVKARDLCIYEVNKDATDINDPSLYRHDIVGFRSPCADAIKAAPEDVSYLLSRCASLEALVRELAGALNAAEAAEQADDDFREMCESADAEGWMNEPTGSSHLNGARQVVCDAEQKETELRRAAISHPLVSELTGEKTEKCPICGGTGWGDPDMPEECATCCGTGEKEGGE